MQNLAKQGGRAGKRSGPVQKTQQRNASMPQAEIRVVKEKSPGNVDVLRGGSRFKRYSTNSFLAIDGRKAVSTKKVKQAGLKASVKKLASRKATATDDSLDPVDAILAQWQRERPDLDPAPMQLFGLMARAQSLSTAHFNERLDKWGLSRGSFDVLAALRRAGPPFTLAPKQLSKSLMLSGAGMTSRLDRLETMKLIVRQPEPNDRRSLKIKLTRIGVRVIDEVVPDILDVQWKIASAMGIEKAASLTRELRRFTDILSGSGRY